MQTLLYLDGLVVVNGSFQPQRLMGDVVSTSTDVFMLIGIAMVGAVIVGVLYAVYLLLTGGG
jgi:hypothetical protein